MKNRRKEKWNAMKWIIKMANPTVFVWHEIDIHQEFKFHWRTMQYQKYQIYISTRLFPNHNWWGIWNYSNLYNAYPIHPPFWLTNQIYFCRKIMIIMSKCTLAFRWLCCMQKKDKENLIQLLNGSSLKHPWMRSMVVFLCSTCAYTQTKLHGHTCMLVHTVR